MMAGVPLISVVMGVFNGAADLDKTISSVLSQEGVALEFIVVDDGSTDNTAHLLAAWARRDSRLRVISQVNRGLTAALIEGCKAAQGEYVARQDCGDISFPSRLDAQAEALTRHSQLPFVSCRTSICTRSGIELYELACGTNEGVPRDILDLNRPHGVKFGPTHHGSVMFRRSCYEQVGGYRPDFYYGQDWDLWYRLAQVGRFMCLPEVLYQASLSPTDISLRATARQRAIGSASLDALRLRLAGLSEAPALARARAIRPGGVATYPLDPPGAGEYFIGECLRRRGEIRLADDYFRAAIRLRSTNFKAWLRRAQLIGMK